VRNTDAIDKAERDDWNAEAIRRAKYWLMWTLLVLVIAYFLPLHWAVLFALFYARLADRDLDLLGELPLALPVPFFFRHLRRKTIYATSVVLKDKPSGNTRARLYTLDNGEPALSLYSESGAETAVFTPGSEMRRIQAFEESNSGTRTLEGRLAVVEAENRRLEEINETLREVQSRIEELEREREGNMRSEKVSSHCFELLDGNGRTRASLETSSHDQPRLAFYDGNGLAHAYISLGDNGYPELLLTNLHESSPSPSEGEKIRSRIVLGFDDEGYPQLLMYDDPEVAGYDPALSLLVNRAEWVGVGEVGVGETRYQSKTAGLLCDAWLGEKHALKSFCARAVEPASGETA